jgi:ABC-type oligopeptide transport system substrate-binding subunit
MNRHHRWMLAILLTACLPLTSCKQTSEAAADEEVGPAKVEHLQGDQPTRVTLTEDAAKRLDIQTATIQDMMVNGAQRRVIPYAAILYDTQGDTWTYTNPEPLVNVRHRIVVDFIEGEMAVLSDGPPLGSAVVVVGAEELFGSELEFEEE